MANILIYSNNPRLAAQWTHALLVDHSVSMLTNVNSDFKADALLCDSKKLDDDANLIAFLADKSIRFLVVGTNWPDGKQIDIMLRGAAGYCEAGEAAEIMQRAVESILKGDIWIRRSLVPKLIGALTSERRINHPKGNQSTDIAILLKQFETLSARELEVAELIQVGESNKRIASELNISERTVKAHLSSIFRKLEIEDRLRLAILLKELEQHHRIPT